MYRISVSLSEDEWLALQRLAADECRYPPEQLRYLLREAAARRGFLPVQPIEASDLDTRAIMPADE